MTEQQYNSPLVQLIWSELLPKVKEAIEGLADVKGHLARMIWKAISPEIPEQLRQIDEDEEAQRKILAILRDFLARVEEASDKAESN